MSLLTSICQAMRLARTAMLHLVARTFGGEDYDTNVHNVGTRQHAGCVLSSAASTSPRQIFRPRRPSFTTVGADTALHDDSHDEKTSALPNDDGSDVTSSRGFTAADVQRDSR